MKPTIGRIVIFKYHTKCEHNNFAEECPAIIVRVWGDLCVNLKLIEDGPVDSWKTSVTLGDGPGSWHWPIILVPEKSTEVKV